MKTIDGLKKIRKFIVEKHSVNCALTDEIIKFIDELEEPPAISTSAQLCDVPNDEECLLLLRNISGEASKIRSTYSLPVYQKNVENERKLITVVQNWFEKHFT